MAMIKCPGWGKEISDKSENCVHCGAVINGKPRIEKECPECGHILTDEAEVCPNCGCPIEKIKPNEPQQVEVTNVRLTVDKKKKKIITAIIILIVILAGGGIGIKFFMENNAKKVYAENYKELVYLMLTGAGDAEDAGGLIHDVWYNTIYEKDSSKTDKYTKDSDGKFYDDFNTSLMLLTWSDSFSSDISDIKKNQEQVQTLMKDMRNPPKEYEEAYGALKDFYDAYTKLVNLAVNPTGNLTSYTSSFNEADTETLNTYKAALLYVED